MLDEQDRRNRRQHDRHPVSFPVAYTGEFTGQGQAADLSVLGCAIVSDIEVPVKTYCKLQLSLPDGDKPLEIQLAVVQWRHGRIFGLEFIAFGEVQKTRLKRFLNSLAAPILSQ